MVMSADEIAVEYRQAKNKSKHLKILADQNMCEISDIVDMLISHHKQEPDWKKALDIVNRKISELTETKMKAERELSEIAEVLGSIGQ